MHYKMFTLISTKDIHPKTDFFLLNSKISNQRNFYYYLYELMR